MIQSTPSFQFSRTYWFGKAFNNHRRSIVACLFSVTCSYCRFLVYCKRILLAPPSPSATRRTCPADAAPDRPLPHTVASSSASHLATPAQLSGAVHHPEARSPSPSQGIEDDDELGRHGTRHVPCACSSALAIYTHTRAPSVVDWFSDRSICKCKMTKLIGARVHHIRNLAGMMNKYTFLVSLCMPHLNLRGKHAYSFY